MVENLLVKSYRGVIYLAQNIIWYFSNKEPREDQLREHLKRVGATPFYLNLYLDSQGVSREAGRFPRLFQTQDSLVDRVVSDCLNLSYFPHNRLFSPQEKREYVALQIAEALKRKD